MNFRAFIIFAMAIPGLAWGNPFNLSELDDIPIEIRPSAVATMTWLHNHQETPLDYVVDIQCGEIKCLIQLYRAKLLEQEFHRSMGCPKPICATLEYNLERDVILEAVHWR